MALLVQSSRAHGYFFFVFFLLPGCYVRCFENEIVLWNYNLCEQHAILVMSHKRPSAVVLEERKRLYTVCCATVSLSLLYFVSNIV